MTFQTYDVRWLQRALKSLGHYAGQVDGITGPRTRTAIVDFKRGQGLWPREFVGPITLARLRDAVGEEPPRRFGRDTAPEPPWLVEIGNVMVLHEVRDNTVLRNWLASDGSTLGDPAQFPWCGDAAITALELALPDEPLPPSLKANPYWARNFAHYGIHCGKFYGAVAPFRRGSGGHIGFDPARRRFLIRGGNQSDSVRDSWLAESRLIDLRWPKSWPASHQRPLPIMDASGAIFSTNEA